MKDNGFVQLAGFSPLFWLKVLALAGTFGAGVWVANKFCEADKVAAVNAVRAEEWRRTKVVTKIETVVQERVRVVREKGKEVVREVPKIITVEVEKACPAGLPNGFVRLHDDAARGTTPRPPAESDASPAGVTLAEASGTIGDNYTEYQVCREQVIGWQQFYDELRKAQK